MTLEEQQKHVQDAAFQRHVAALQREAKETKTDTQKWRSTVQGGLDQERGEIMQAREAAQQNQQALRNQIEENKARRLDTRKEFIEAASSHAFPLFTETFISETEVEAYRKQQKQLWREELNQQMITTKTLRNLEEKKHHDHAIRTAADQVGSMSRARYAESERLANMGHELVNSWERDCKLKSLRKAMHTGKDVARELEAHAR